MKGQIVKIVSDLHYVNCDNETFPCKCRGIFRNKNITPVVGDFCEFSKEKLVIEKILPRLNIFNRPKVANITQAIIVTSLKNPDFSINLLDRFLTILHINNVKPVICITKEDLVEKTKLEKIRNILSYYEQLGYTVTSNTNIDKIKELLKNETTVFTGQTGAGKSTLINKIDENLSLEVGEISLSLGRGKHTTRTVSLYEIASGKVLDTPGFSLIDFNNLDKEQIKNSFIEFKKFPCIYKDCSHTNEIECRVKKAVKDNEILKERYEDYLKFIGR